MDILNKFSLDILGCLASEHVHEITPEEILETLAMHMSGLVLTKYGDNEKAREVVKKAFDKGWKEAKDTVRGRNKNE